MNWKINAAAKIISIYAPKIGGLGQNCRHFYLSQIKFGKMPEIKAYMYQN